MTAENSFRIGVLIGTIWSGLYWLGDPASRGHYLVAVAAGVIVFLTMFGGQGDGKQTVRIGAMAACCWTMAVEYGVL